MEHIFVHGLGQDSKSWDYLIKKLNLVDDINTPDLSKIVLNKELNYQNLYNSFYDICEERKEQVHLCGLSLGAILCMNYAIENPERVASLILIAPQYKIPKMLFKIQNVIFKLMPKSMFANMGFSKKDTLSLTKSMTNLNFTKGLESINCPTLILCGEKDSANLKASRELVKLIPQSKFFTVSDSKHEVNIDNPDSLAMFINEFHDQI